MRPDCRRLSFLFPLFFLAQSPDAESQTLASAEAAAPAVERPAPPLTVGGRAVIDLSAVSGESSGLVGRVLFDASALIDLEPALGLANTTVFLQYYGKVGGNGSERLGDLQGFSNIDADDFRGIGEAWIQVRRWTSGCGSRAAASTPTASSRACTARASS